VKKVVFFASKIFSGEVTMKIRHNKLNLASVMNEFEFVKLKIEATE